MEQGLSAADAVLPELWSDDIEQLFQLEL